MSESVASALEFLDNDRTKETRRFIRMVDRFFDYLNVRSPLVHQLKRKESIAPYAKPTDERFKVHVLRLVNITIVAVDSVLSACIVVTY